MRAGWNKRILFIYLFIYLEVEDDGPDEAENDGRLAVHNVAGVDVHQLYLGQNSTRS